MCGLPFFQGYFNLIDFDRSWFLIDLNFYKPGIFQGLSLNFNSFLEFFLEMHRFSNFSSNVLKDFSVFVFDGSKRRVAYWLA